MKKLDLVKLTFLLVQESKNLPPAARYDFVPYQRGPFSFTLYHDLGTLEAVGLIEAEGEHAVRITSHGRICAGEASERISASIKTTLQEHARRSTKSLIDFVYAQYPFYTMNSEWVERRAIERPISDPQVYIVGYEGLSLDALLTTLLKCGIRRLIDVRANPVARRYGFHRSTLEKICPRLEIEYIHRPELGIESSWRENLEGQPDYDRLFARYVKETLPKRKKEIAEIATSMCERPSALMCLEADPLSCHRYQLAKKVSKMTAMPILDLRENQGALV